MTAKDPTLSYDPCRLQTSIAPPAEDAGWFTVHRVIDKDKVPDDNLHLQTQSIESISLAWAVLLRSYVANDTVSFALIPDRGQFELPPSQKDTLELVNKVRNLSVLQYHAVSGRKWHDRTPDAHSTVLETNIEEIPINTAVRLCETSSSNSARVEDIERDTTAKWIDAEVVVVKDGEVPGMVLLRTRNSKLPFAYGQSIARTFRSIIIGNASRPEANCCSLPKVSMEDKQFLTSWYLEELHSRSTCLHHIVGLTVSSKPDDEAVCAWDGAMTYAELDYASTNFARQLRQNGVQVGDLVPLSFEKSLYAVIAAIAILKAGAAFVPLDPKHPTTRIEEVLETVQADLIVTSVLWEHKYIQLGKKTFVVSAALGSINDQVQMLILPSVGPQDPAFILFTSGSTGQPKGMLHDHAAAVTHGIANGECMGYNARVFQFSAFTFDMAVWDMFSTLILGGCICIPSDEDRLNNIPQAMNSLGVEFAFLTPSVASLLQPAEILTLKRLACGGEVFRQEIVQRWKGKIELINQYGIAEVGTIAVRHLDHDAPTSRTATVGYTLPTLRCVLVDPEDHDRLVPIGAIGELMVTGTTISRGYLNSEAKNRSSFVTNAAWADELGLKDRVFYKTGDLLQYNVGSFDGKMDFVRRKDGQLKYHGQRMEAGEVEHHLDEIHGVAVSAVVLPEQGCFKGQLVAAVQMSSSVLQRFIREPLWVDHTRKLPLRTIKAHLSRSLPGYMIPAECVVIGNMPFTPSCKVDRKSVRAWLEGLKSRPDETTVAEIPMETSPLAKGETTARAISLQIAEMIASRDNSQGVQLEDQDFLIQSSGVDSIQTASLAIFVQNTFGVKLPIGVFLSSTGTVRDVARIIDEDTLALDDHSVTVDLLKEVEVHRQELFYEPNPSLSLSNEYSRPVTTRNVFLTGASGYLGSRILQKLLEGSEVRVSILSRCPSIAEAFEQLMSKANRHGWWHDEYASRIDIWQGDLTEPRLGLNNESLDRLRGKSGDLPCIDAIIHNGAKVHYSLDYEALKPSNLQSTKELLAIAAGAANISTLIYISGGRLPSAIELSEAEDSFEAQRGSGYAQSKFVAEYLVRRSMHSPAFAAKTVRVVRPGYIIGSPTDGIANLTDFIWRLIAGCVEIQAYNQDDQDRWLFVSDVEHVANVVTSSITHPNNSTSHAVDQILDGTYLSSLWTILRLDCGYALNPLPHHHWLQILKSSIMDRGESHLLFPLLHTLENGEGMVGSKNPPPENTESNRRVKNALLANIQYLTNRGFLQAPSPEPGTSNASPRENVDDEHKVDERATDRASLISQTSLQTKSSTSSASTDNMSSAHTSVGEDEESCEKTSTERLLAEDQMIPDGNHGEVAAV